MSATSGQYGTAKIGSGSSCIAEVDKWSISKSCVLHDYATCETPGNGGMGVLAGRRRHSGSMSGIYDPSDPIESYINEGDTVTLKLYYTAAKYYTGTCVIETLNIPDVDIYEGAPVRWDSTFRVHGLLTKV